MDDQYMGTILLWAGNFIPRNFMPCDGRSLSINQYTALFSILGTIYGGNGTTTFCLPDLRGRVPVNYGTGPNLSPYNLGDKGGAEGIQMSASQLAVHNHANTLTTNASNVNVPISIPSVIGSDANTVKPTSTTCLGKMGSTFMYSTNTPDSNLMPFTATGTVTPLVSITNASAGGNAPINVRQPYLALNFIICFQGLYPSRS